MTVGVAQDAARKVATVTQMTVTEANALVTSIHVEVAEVTPSVGASVDGQSLSGVISVSIGDSTGTRVEVVNGQATIALDTKDVLGKVVTVNYSGDATHAWSSRSLAI